MKWENFVIVDKNEGDKVVKGMKIEIAGFEDYLFFVHEAIGYNVDEETEIKDDVITWALSEQESGCAISNNCPSMQEAIDKATANLNKAGAKKFEELVQQGIKMRKQVIENLEQNSERHQIWASFNECGYTLLDSEIEDIKTSLAKRGFEITKIKTP